MSHAYRVLRFGRLEQQTNVLGVHVRSRRITVVALSLALLVAGCSSGSTQSEKSQSPTPTPTPTPVWPLTGLPSMAASKTKPVLVIKVENDPGVRPQSGLDKADVIFEELVEGGITRFATIFQSTYPKEVGPVRSVRHVDASIAAPVADYFIFSGGARPTLRYLRANLPKEVKILTEGAPGMYRSKKHYAPHNLYLNPQVLVAKSKHSNNATEGIFYRPSESELSSATPTPSTSSSTQPLVAKLIAVSAANARFSNGEASRWVWNSARKEWLRFEGQRKHTNTSGVQLGVPVLVALNVKTVDAGYRDPAGNYVPRTVFTGTGTGYVLQNGRALAVKWSKSDLDTQVKLTDVTGKPVALKAGRIWVDLIPHTGSFTLVKAPVAKPSASAK